METKAIYNAIEFNNVKINDDITKYLPNTSETRIGMNIMEEEFANVETSTLNIMFKNLKNDEKENILKYLNEIEGIKKILILMMSW